MMSYIAHNDADDDSESDNTRNNINKKLSPKPQPRFGMDEIDGNLPSENGNDEIDDLLSSERKGKPDVSIIEVGIGDDKLDGAAKPTKNLYASKKNVAEGMMDIALLTANANQLRFLITYNTESKTYYVSLVLIVLSLVLQISVGIALIFKRQMKNKGNRNKADRTNDYLVVGVFLVTVINVFVASFTITDAPPK